MSSTREALQGRFRASLQKRVGNIAAMLELLELMPHEPDATRQVLGELHTLKGEARMVGALALADLTHALEEVVGGGGLDFRSLGRAVEAMQRALQDESVERSDALLLGACQELTGESGERAAATTSQPAPEPGLPSQNRTEYAAQRGAGAYTSDRPRAYEPQGARSSLSMPPADSNGDVAAAERNVVEREGPARATRAQSSSERDGVKEAASWVSVEAAKIDEVCERVTTLAEGFGQLQRRVMKRLPKQGSRVEQTAIADAFIEYRQLLEACVEVTWGLRLVRIAPMLQRLEQHARLLAQREGLALDVLVDAGSVQLERDVVDLVWDSLVHLVRNCVAHGIEPAAERGGKPRRGLLELRAESSGPHVAIVVRDDGRGVDPQRLRQVAVERRLLSVREADALSDQDALQLVFRHGFSTEQRADDLSGRGVGLDVVKEKIEGIGGSVRFSSTLGQGTKVALIVPFAITKERIVVFDSGSGLYGIPVRVVQRVLGIEELSLADDKSVRFAGEAIALRSLTRSLTLPIAASETSALVVELGGKLFALRVQRVLGERDLIRRPAEPLLAKATGIGASAVLNDGRLVLLFDLAFLERSLQGHAPSVAQPAPTATKRTRVVVVDDSPVVTEMVSELLTTAGLSVEVARDGVQALAAIEREAPDLVISDLEMPNMNGLELLARIRERSQTLPVVMLTTRGSVDDRKRAAAAGANAYVLKSGFRSDVLLDVVGRFLNLR